MLCCSHDVLDEFYQKITSTIHHADAMPLTIVSRKRWRGMPHPKQYYPIDTPARYVFLGYTATQRCNSYITCQRTLALLQARMGKVSRRSDIIYNFLISDEGVAYEARGWRSRACYPNRYEKKFVHQSYYIGFIGDFSETPPTNKMHQALDEFLHYAMEYEYIDKKFNMILLNIRCSRLLD